MKPKPAACNHLQLTLPRIERDEARARIAERGRAPKHLPHRAPQAGSTGM
jgi:hypothetical protein